MRIDRQVLADAKRLAAETGHTLTAVIEESLKETLARRKKSKGSGPVKLTLYGGDGVFPGVDLDDMVSLLDAMERSR